jgi:hypothetical protein
MSACGSERRNPDTRPNYTGDGEPNVSASYMKTERNVWLLKAKDSVKQFTKTTCRSSTRPAGSDRMGDFCKQQFRMLYNGDRPVGVVPWALAD